MEIVLNEHSLDGQFENSLQFGDYLEEYLIQMFKIVSDLNISLIKSELFYQNMVTNDKSLLDVITNMRGDPALSAFRKYLISMYDAPYWENDAHTKETFTYECEYTSKVPNCFSEALERDRLVMSFKVGCFCETILHIRRDGQDYELRNMLSGDNLIKYLWTSGLYSTKYLIEQCRYALNMTCYGEEDNCYLQEAVEEAELSEKDMLAILDGMSEMTKSIVEKRSTRYTKDIGNGLYEFRLSVCEGREFRVFYIYGHKREIVFLNGYIKKDQSIPMQQRKKAENCMQRIAKKMHG